MGLDVISRHMKEGMLERVCRQHQGKVVRRTKLGIHVFLLLSNLMCLHISLQLEDDYMQVLPPCDWSRDLGYMILVLEMGLSWGQYKELYETRVCHNK